MNKHFRVSVLLPVWNGGRYLAQAIESALAQTLQPFEIIVVDNGSTDETPRVIESYANVSLVRAYRNSANIGAVPNWQLAASYARGDYLTWLPADDLLKPTCLALAAHWIGEMPDIGLYASGFEMIDESGLSGPAVELTQFGGAGKVDSTNWIDHLIDKGQPNVVAGTLVRRDLFERLGGFDLELRGACDYDLYLRLAGSASVFVEPSAQVICRQHAAQGSAAISIRDNGDPDRFFEKAGDYAFFSEDQLRRFIENLCDYARQYFHRPLRQDGVSAADLFSARDRVYRRLARWRAAGRPYSRFVRLTPKKPTALAAWYAASTQAGAWLAGLAARRLSPRKIYRPGEIRVDIASEPPPSAA